MKTKKSVVRRFLSIVLAVTLALSLAPMNSLGLNVYAEETKTESESVGEPETEATKGLDESSPAETETAGVPETPEHATTETETNGESRTETKTETDSETESESNTEPETEEDRTEISEITLPQSNVPDTDSLPDSDELFEGYVMQAFYGNSGITAFANYGESKLTGNDLEIYKTLKNKIGAVAAGTESSSQFVIDVNGKDITYDGNTKAFGGVDIDLIIDTLLADCPYELYWYDKSSAGGLSIGIKGPESEGLFSVTELTLSFSVVSAYAGSGNYTTDTAKTGATSAAVSNANAIVNANDGKSDYEKLAAYRDAICSRVSYNHDAAAGAGASGGDPWQMIYVFDDDSSTNVVCEGYSKAFQYLCDKGGLICYTVTGNMTGATGAGEHMWNIVVLNGQSYLVDVTNCDEGTVGQYGGLFLAGAAEGTEDGYRIHIPSHDLGSGSYIQETSVTYTYDDNTKVLYSAEIRTLAKSDYIENEPEPGASTVIDLSTLTGSFQLKEEDGQNKYSTDGGTNWTAYTGSITLKDGETKSANQNVLVQNGTHDVTIYNATLAGNDVNKGAFSIFSGASVNLTLIGKNQATSQYSSAGICVPEGAFLTITSQSTGSLTVQGGEFGAGIGVSGSNNSAGNITIDGGTINATGNKAAGIGGGYSFSDGGNITINGGTVIAETINYGFAGIGGGSLGNGGIITINGGTVTATGGSGCAGIGGGNGVAGVGGNGGTITINGGTVTATGGANGAGIGGGSSGDGGTIIINGGTVTAMGKSFNGAGIGGGDHGDGGSITISGGTITATGVSGGAGIGGGKSGSGGTVIVTGGSIKAVAGENASTIGAGEGNSDNGSLTNGNETVSLVTIMLDGVDGALPITALDGAEGYGLKDVTTMDTNKLYFYLPEKISLASITADNENYVGTLDDNRTGTYAVQVSVIVASVSINGGEAEYYTSIEEAWAAALEGTDEAPATLTLLQSVDLGKDYLSMAGGNIVLEMSEDVTLSGNSTSMTTGIIYITGGNFTLKSGTIAATNSYGRGIFVTDGSFTQEGGAITTNGTYSRAVQVTGGKAEIKGGTVAVNGSNSSSSAYGVYVTGGSVVISGGEISASEFADKGVWVEGTGSVILTGGTVRSNSVGLYVKAGTALIDGATITDNGSTMSVYGVSAIGGSFEMRSGTIEVAGSNRGVYVWYKDTSVGNAKISGGTIKSTGSSGYGVYVSGTDSGDAVTATITGGNFTGANGAVYVTGKTGVADISGGTFDGTRYALYMARNSTVRLSGGTFSSTDNSVYISGGGKTIGDLLVDGYAYYKGEKVLAENYIQDESVRYLKASKGYGTVTVAKPTVVIDGPEDRMITYGYSESDAPTLEIQATPVDENSDIVYQWYKADGTEIDGATEQTYTIPVNLATGKRQYYCVVTCGDYRVTSRTAVLMVQPAPLTISSATANNKIYDGTVEANVDTVVFEGLVNGETLLSGVDYIVTAAFENADIGTAKNVAGSITLNNSNYTLNNNSFTTTADIEAASLSNGINIDLNLPDEGYVYDGSEHRPGVIVMRNGDHLVENTDYTIAYVNNINAGTARVIINGTGNYNGSASENFAIAKKAVSATVTAEDKIYDGSTEATVTATVETGVDGEALIISGLRGTFEDANAGTGKTVTVDKSGIRFSGNADLNNYDVAIGNRVQANIIGAAMTATAVDYIGTYDGRAHGITITPSEQDAVIRYGTVEGSYDRDSLTYTKAGIYTVYYQVTKNNYNTVAGSATVRIEKQPIRISGITAQDKIYDKTDGAVLNYSGVVYDGLVNDDVLSISAAGKFTDVNAGQNKTVNISDIRLDGADAENYVLADDGQQETTDANISAKDITVTITSNGGIYADTITPAVAAVNGVIDGDIVNVDLLYTGTANDGTDVKSAEAPIQAGTYTVTASITNGNYQLVGETAAQFVIDKADGGLTVSMVADKTYGDNGFKLDVTRNGDGHLTYDSSDTSVLVVDENGWVEIVGAGKATLTVTDEGNANYYGDSKDVTVTVDKKNGTLTVVDFAYENIVYGDADFSIGEIISEGESTIRYESSNPEVVTVDENGHVRIVGAGTATISLTMEESRNYNRVDTKVTITVSPKAVTVTADNQTRTYGEKDPLLAWTAEGLVGEDQLEGITVTRKAGEDVGEYPITVSQSEDMNPNYDITFVDGSLTIQARDIADARVELGDGLTADGKMQTQEILQVIVRNADGEALDVTYTAAGIQGREPGVYMMTLTGTGNFTGTVTKTFVVAPAADSKVDTDTNGDVVIGEGTIGTRVEEDEKAPEAEIKTDQGTLIEMLTENGDLTAEDLSRTAEGADIRLILKVTAADDAVSEESRAQIEKAVAGYTIGQYVNIHLFKETYREGEVLNRVQLTETRDNVKISVKVPENLLNKDESITRTFYIVRNYEGKVEFLPALYDATENALVFETNRFSDYAIVYKDTKPDDNGTNKPNGNGTNTTTGNGKKPLNTATGTVPRTGDSMKVGRWLAVMFGACGIMIGSVVYGKRKKKQNR